MAKIIIDGYNLIGTAHRDLKKARTMLIERLIEYRKTRGHNIVLVFDGYKEGTGKEKAEILGGIKIIYSGIGEKADDVIKRILKTEKAFWIVISSDKEIEKFAWREDCVAISSYIFWEVLDGEKFSFENIKGFTLSKKEKAIRKAIMKLI